tara:strand:+ start:58 stop:468 length:411 start_codon:yes stop_codon:yes gene_type:complete
MTPVGRIFETIYIMKKHPLKRNLLLCLALALTPFFQGQVSDQQRKQLRELLRYQRAYNEQLDQARKQLLEKDEELQLVYSEMVEAERIYLEASRQYQGLLEKKLKANPAVNGIQAKLDKINQQIRQVGSAPKPPRR